MTLLTSDVKPLGGIAGAGNVIVVDHTTDNALMTFRFRNHEVKMLAAEDDFEVKGHKFRAGAFIIPDADRASIEPSIQGAGTFGDRRYLHCRT